MTGRGRHEYLAMPDNGYGRSQLDGLLDPGLLHPARLQDSAAAGADDRVATSSFSDPDHRRVDRARGTNDGSDRRRHRPGVAAADRNGDFWMGDEFGPWILHFDSTGKLLDAPFPIGVKSPNNPFLGGEVPPHPNSRLRGHGPDAQRQDPLCGPRGTNRRGCRHDQALHLRVQHGREGLDEACLAIPHRRPAYMVADMWALDRHRLVVIERDGERGLAPSSATSTWSTSGTWRRTPGEGAGRRPDPHRRPGSRLAAPDPRGRRGAWRSVPGHLRVGGGDPCDRRHEAPDRLRQHAEHRSKPRPGG